MRFNLSRCYHYFVSLTTVLILLCNHVNLAEPHPGMVDDWAEVYDIDELLCEISQQGLYGEESDHMKLIKYDYTMEYERSSDTYIDGDIDDAENTEHIESIIKGIETVIMSSILKSTSLFNECQVVVERRGRKMAQLRPNMSHGRRLDQSVIGITTKPDDGYSIIDCTSDAISNESTCVSVQGELTLYLEDSSSELHKEGMKEIQSVLQSLLSADGSLVTETRSILKMEYIQDANGNTSSLESRTGLNSVQKASISIGSILGVALFGLLGFGGYKWRKRRQRDAGIAEYNNHFMQQIRHVFWKNGSK